MTARVHYVSHPRGDGLGDAAAGYRAVLLRAGVDVRTTTLRWGPSGLRPDPGPDSGPDDVTILHVLLEWAGRALEWYPSGRRIGLVTWEADAISAEVTAALNRYDGLVVPSRFNRETFVRCGVTTPIWVVPHVLPATPRIRGVLPEIDDDRFLFYIIATWSTRKCVPETVRAFCEAFGPDDGVALLVKTTTYDHMAVEARRADGDPPGRTEETWWSLAGLIGGRRTAPVHLVAGDLPESHVQAIHTRGDCALAVTRSEGFGLVPYHAGAYGNPSIVTGFGALPEILPAGYPWLVDHHLVPTSSDAPDGWIQRADDQRWARPDFTHAAALMRQVSADPGRSRALGAQVRDHLRRTYGHQQVTAALLAAIHAVAARAVTATGP